MGTIQRSIAQSVRGKILCVLILAIAFSLNAQVTKEQIAKSLQIEKLQHPYLFFTKDDIPAILKRIEIDQECKDIYASLKVRAHRWLYFQIKDPAPLPPKHPRYVAGGNPAFSYYQELTEGGLTLGFLYQLTGDLAYAKKAIAFAVAMSDLPDWTDDTHKFDIIYPRVWPKGVPDDQVVFSIDCWGPEKASTVSTIYDWVYPVLTKWERDKIRGAILEKAITKVRGNYEFHWWSYATRCNWSVICNNGMGLSALTLLKEDPQLIDVVAESYNRIGRTLDQIDEDGGWQEGRGYYQVLLRLGAPFMGALEKVSKGTYNLFQHKNLKNHPLDFLLYGLTAGFGDGGGGPMGPGFMVNKLVEESGDAAGAWYREKFVNPRYERYPNSGVFDIIWPRPSVKPVEPTEKSKLFRGVNWAVMRSDFLDPSSVTIACKAGYNDDPHHGHLDCGHFVLTWHGVAFIRDIPGGGYDELYFNEDRWLYPGASSAGHNTVIVNGELQISAKLKDQPWKEGVGGKILDFRTSDKRDYVLMDPTKAYPGKELKKWRRNIILEKPVVTVILDEVGASPGSTIQARFFPSVPPAEPRTGGGRGEPRAPSTPVVGVDYKVLKDHVLMSAQRRTMVLIPLVLENTFTIVENALPAQPAREEQPLTWTPYFETVTKAKSSTSIIVTLVLPVNGEKEAEAMVKTAKVVQSSPNELEASVSTSSGTLKWVFAKDKDGYALKN